jgi:hypothetical protein
MVRHDEPQAGPHARLLIDTQTVGYRDVVLVRNRVLGRREADSATFEWNVRMAASAAVHLAERGYTVELVTPTEPAAEAALADGPAGDVLGSLALVTLGERTGDLDERVGGGQAPIVAIVGSPDEATMRWMLAQRTARAPAVALLAGVAAPATHDELSADPSSRDPDPVRSQFERAGWSVARVSINRAPDEAWLELLGEPTGTGTGPDWVVLAEGAHA